jgi:N-glycosidase YbiA
MGGPGEIDGKIHKECDNFAVYPFKADGVTYLTAEHYFQVQKTEDEAERQAILNKKSPLDAWVLGNQVTLRPGWEKMKVNVMYEGNKARFEQNPEIIKSLCDTKGSIKMSGSTTFWNKWNGKIMERLRAEFRASVDDLIVAEKLRKEMEDYANQN